MFGKHASLLFSVSAGFLVIAIVLAAWGFPKIVSRQIQKNIQLDNSSVMFDKWVKLPMPITFKVSVFNVTNPDEVNAGQKPKLAEVGPYVYKEYRERTILGYGANDTIKYNLKKTFFFDQEESGELKEDDEIVVINTFYLAIILKIQDMMPSMVSGIHPGLEQFFVNLTDPFLRVKVRDLFFDGVYVSCEGDHYAVGLICNQIKTSTPQTARLAEDGRGYYFSMFSHMNRTEAGPYEMVRGTENVADLGKILSYQGQKTMPQWGNSYCGQINGSDSSVFPPIDETNVPKRLYTFEPNLCRSMFASLVGKTTVFNMSAYHYEISEEALAAKSANPNNKCFCKKNWSANHDGCLIMGVLNLAPCLQSDVIVSLPHFYLASEELLEYFAAGVAPEREKHNSYVYIDPITGVVLKGVQRLQFNIELRRFPDIQQLEKVPVGLFPQLWVEERAVLPHSLQEELRQSHTLLGYVEIARWALLAIAILATVATGAARAWSLLNCSHRNSVNFISSNITVNGNKLH